jgi:hypothetical protein
LEDVADTVPASGYFCASAYARGPAMVERMVASRIVMKQKNRSLKELIWHFLRIVWATVPNVVPL